MNESIDNIINKFINYKIKRSELEEVAPFIGTEDFNEHYQLVEDVNAIFQEKGRNELRNELKGFIESEKRIEKRGKIIQLKEYRLQAIAACILVVCALGVIKSTTGYNDHSKFRKTYIERYEG